MSWEILNANRFRWGQEAYPSKEEAEKALRDFWRGTGGVDLKKFVIREIKDDNRASDRSRQSTASLPQD